MEITFITNQKDAHPKLNIINYSNFLMIDGNNKK